MANRKQLKLLKVGGGDWNNWRLDNNWETPIDLTGANLRGADLIAANLSEANLRGADLYGADLMGASLALADLRKANLSEANLGAADFYRTNLSGANLTGANLSTANLIRTNINNTKISKCNVYGVNVWDLQGKFKEQKDLIITPPDEPTITVDNIKIAQFVHLILNNQEIGGAINTLEDLLEYIDTAIISRALAKHNQLRLQKSIAPELLTIKNLKKGKK